MVAMNPKILIVEDDPDMRQLIEATNLGLGHDVECAADGKSGFDKAISGDYQLVILDVMLPQMTGIEICAKLREKGIRVPVLMVSSQSQVDDKVQGLDVGADDYVIKPFNMKELVARIKALMRRSTLNPTPEGTNKESILRFEGIEIDLEKRRVKVENKPVDLTAIEFDLLAFLANSPGRPFTREELMKEVWGYHSTRFDATITSHLSRLRSKIEPGNGKPKYVQTMHGVGYRFMDDDE